MNPSFAAVTAVLVVLLAGRSLHAHSRTPGAEVSARPGIAAMPVREITVFKDGHAFVMHEGAMPTNADGNVVLDYLPTPVLGTFWPSSAEPDVKLTAVIAGRRGVTVERTALSVRELLEASPGAEVQITERRGVQYPARVVGVPVRTTAELGETGPPGAEQRLPEKGSAILLETPDGVKALPLDHIADVTFRRPPQPRLAETEFRDLLALNLDWAKRDPAPTARVAMMYLQKGVRWIPHYKIAIDGESRAVVTLQATLLNELTDLRDVTAHLVIGVPSFAFRDAIDPIALQQTLAQLSPHFTGDARTPYLLSNAIMSQRVDMSPGTRAAGRAAPGTSLGPEVGDGTEHEDLFIFTVQHLSLNRGERMVLPIAEFTLDYTDVFTLDIPFAPPPEVRQSFNRQRQAELARLLATGKVKHRIRLANQSEFPLTTAPALIVRDGRPLGQGMMTYTAAGASTDLEITTAVGIQVDKTDAETGRTPDAVKWNGHSYGKVELAGTIAITNHRGKAVALEVTRYVLGRVGSADHDGTVKQINVFEEESWAARGTYPTWWYWYGWPTWWYHLNGQASVTWRLALPAGERVELDYTWHYFWR